MPSVIVLAGPVCGAPLAPESSRCAYCGSVVVIQTDHPRIDPRLLNKAVVDEHIARYRTAVRQDPNDETAHYALGVAYFNLGLLDDAATELAEAARLMPENPHIQAQLAVVYTDLAINGRPEAARFALDRVDRALLLRPNLLDALLIKATLHELEGRWEAAVGTWREVAAQDPAAARDPLIRFLRGHASTLPRALDKAPDSATVKLRYTLKYVLLAFGTIVGALLLAGAGSIVGTWLILTGLGLAVLAPIAVVQIGNRRWEAVSSARESLIVQQTLTSAEAAPTTALLEMAQRLATELHRPQPQPRGPNIEPAAKKEREPRKAPETASEFPTERWEYCEINAHDKGKLAGLAFSADVVNPKRRYVAAKAENFLVENSFPPKANEINRRRVQSMVNKLLRQGWEPQPKGSEWYSYRFRCRLK